ncbi:hypothetical protein BN903_10 [Halorubrum sp. AJ67]|nr:hypothetical protein BN903_10 [Halorubrum sp. AJ67]
MADRARGGRPGVAVSVPFSALASRPRQLCLRNARQSYGRDTRHGSVSRLFARDDSRQAPRRPRRRERPRVDDRSRGRVDHRIARFGRLAGRCRRRCLRPS